MSFSFCFSSFSDSSFFVIISLFSCLVLSFSFKVLFFFNLFDFKFFLSKIFIVVECFFKVWKVFVFSFLIFFIFFVLVLSSLILNSDIVLFNIAETLFKSNSVFFRFFLKELFGEKILALFCSMLFFSNSSF